MKRTWHIRFFMLLFIVAFHSNFSAQFSWVQLGVNGLTCSQCCRSVELGIRKLDFVDNVEMNLEHTEGKVTFKPGMEVSVEKIARAVVDAGFSVRYLKAGFVFNNVAVTDNSCFSFDHHNFQFIKTGSKTLNGVTEINFLGKNFQAPSDYKKWKADLKPACTKPKEELLFVTL